VARNSPGIDSRLTRLINPNQQTTVIQLTAEAHGVLKEHIGRYYSNGIVSEVLINLVKFYESNDGPKYYND
jgi:hypothetical protein